MQDYFYNLLKKDAAKKLNKKLDEITFEEAIDIQPISISVFCRMS